MAQHPFIPRSLVGKRITHVARVLYEYRGEVDPGDGALELGLDGQTLLLDGESDGERLRVSEQPWVDPFEEPLSEENRRFVETHGKWRRVDCSRSDVYSGLLGQVITDACALNNKFGTLAGLRISVPTAGIWFVVDGDESHVYWAQPIGFTEVKSRR
jgi:hypothetical protein